MQYSPIKPKEEILEEYYKAWRMGFSRDKIFHLINLQTPLSKDRFESAEPFFFNYVRERMRNDLNKGTFKMELTQELEEMFIDHIRAGVPMDKVAKIMNIPMATLLGQWLLDPLFKAKVDFAIESANVAVVKALHKKAVGYDKTLVTQTTTTTKGRINKDGESGGDMTVESETVRQEHIQPSAEAIKFWLINKSPDQWSTEGGMSKDGNKGKILEAIDEMTEMTPEEEAECS